MYDVMILGVTNYMLGAGFNQSDIDAVISNFRIYLENLPITRLTIRFNADGSSEEDQGNRGTWWVEGNILIDEDGERTKYFVDGDNLTLIYSSEFLLDALREDDDLTDEALVWLREIFDEDVNIRLFFKRR